MFSFLRFFFFWLTLQTSKTTQISETNNKLFETQSTSHIRNISEKKKKSLFEYEKFEEMVLFSENLSVPSFLLQNKLKTKPTNWVKMQTKLIIFSVAENRNLRQNIWID